MTNELALKSFQLKNYKAIQDSGVVEFSPLTVLIGDNGSGKSSLIEGLFTYQLMVTEGLHESMNEWRGFEYILNAAMPADTAETSETDSCNKKSISFDVRHLLRGRGKISKRYTHRHTVTVGNILEGKQIHIIEETWQQGRKTFVRKDAENRTTVRHRKKNGAEFAFPNLLARTCWPIFAFPDENESNRFDVFASAFYVVSSWQFLTLNPKSMGQPQPQKRTGGPIYLSSDGANIAEYLSDILEQDPESFDSILEAMQYVMPYLRDLRPVLTDILGRQMHVEMTEADFKVMGWLLSTGTLRILALLALFRHPKPPPLIVIEEIENGLDPRTMQLLVEELRNVVESGRSQVIVTTHSPYLLDLLDLSDIVVVERTEDHGPVFFRPSDKPELERWAENFSPGRLYTMQGLRLGAV